LGIQGLSPFVLQAEYDAPGTRYMVLGYGFQLSATRISDGELRSYFARSR
jgi:hypothetical protein